MRLARDAGGAIDEAPEEPEPCRKCWRTGGSLERLGQRRQLGVDDLTRGGPDVLREGHDRAAAIIVVLAPLDESGAVELRPALVVAEVRSILFARAPTASDPP